ncbi:hypothetical protein [Rummeliibacillus stabekisii]|uniref:hypothetical protein n=1 Tax=Rummeliibacillus stabekisii TaxID=241244 RepID=UPI003722CEAA
MKKVQLASQIEDDPFLDVVVDVGDIIIKRVITAYGEKDLYFLVTGAQGECTLVWLYGGGGEIGSILSTFKRGITVREYMEKNGNINRVLKAGTYSLDLEYQ